MNPAVPAGVTTSVPAIVTWSAVTLTVVEPSGTSAPPYAAFAVDVEPVDLGGELPAPPSTGVSVIFASPSESW